MPRNRIAMYATCALVCAGVEPLAAAAQTPSYATRTETITGSITSVQSVNHLVVADDRGYTDDVTLRANATIGSSGLRLEPGQRVTIDGSAAGRTFVATRIATSARVSAAPASGYSAPAYYPAPVYYPVPVYYPAPVSYSVGYGYPGFYGGYYGGGYYRGGFGGFGGYVRFGSGYGFHRYGRGYGGGYRPFRGRFSIFARVR